MNEERISSGGKGESTTHDEQQSLISASPREGSPDLDATPFPLDVEDDNGEPAKRPTRGTARRQSSLAQHRPDGTPRTANRVRFQVEDDAGHGQDNVAHEDADDWLEEDDYMSNGFAHHGRGSYGQRAPLLTDIEAPSVTIASEFELDPEDLLDSAKSKSGMRSAFMNMANSIM